MVRRSSVGFFIAENLARDPKAQVFGKSVAGFLARDLHEFVSAVGPAFLSRLGGAGQQSETAHKELLEKLTKILGQDNLVGSAGEFGLLFAFLANKPGAQHVGHEQALLVDDLRLMFVEKKLPYRWKT